MPSHEYLVCSWVVKYCISFLCSPCWTKGYPVGNALRALISICSIENPSPGLQVCVSRSPDLIETILLNSFCNWYHIYLSLLSEFLCRTDLCTEVAAASVMKGSTKSLPTILAWLGRGYSGSYFLILVLIQMCFAQFLNGRNPRWCIRQLSRAVVRHLPGCWGGHGRTDEHLNGEHLA